MVATAVLFSSVFSAMYGVFIKHRFQHTYDAILAAPVDVEELVTAEVAWLGVRAGVYGIAPLLVTMLFGLDPSWGMLAVPFIGAITGVRASPASGVFAAASVSKIDHFTYIQSALITPLFLVSGTFFPIDELPQGRRSHPSSTRSTTASSSCATRSSASRRPTSYHLAVLIGLRARHWRLAIWRMEKRLIE